MPSDSAQFSPLKITLFPIVLSLLICCLFGCSRTARRTDIGGEVFIVTAGHESIKLGLVEIGAFDKEEVRRAVEAKKPEIAAESDRFSKLSSEISEFCNRVTTQDPLESDCIVLSLHRDWLKRYLDSAQPFFESLPKPIATAKTDSNGRFHLQTKRAANEIVLGAVANRKIGDSTEYYNWLVAPETPSDVTLSNDNLTTSASQQSIIHVLEEGTGPTDETVDSLAAKFQDLAAQKSSEEKRINEAKPHATPASTRAKLKQSVSFQLPYGNVTFVAGTEFEIMSRDESEVHLRVLGSEQVVPISAVDFK
jgi:hypothetical protein